MCCCAHRRGLSGGCWPSVAVRATAGDWDTKGFLSPALAAHEVLDEFLNLGVASHLAVLAGEQPVRVPLGPARGQRGTAAAPPRHRTWDSPRGTAVPLLPLLQALYPLPFSSSSWAASAWAGSAAGELSSMGSPSVQGSHVLLETSLPQEGGCGWSSPVLEAHQVLDQLPHVGVAVHLAELAVEEPVCVALRPARWNSKGGSRGMV